MPLMLIATDLVLGRGGDKHPSVYEAMFLPDVLREVVAERLQVEPVLLYQRHGPPFSKRPHATRLLLLWIALLLSIPLWVMHRRGRFSRLLSAPTLLVLSLAGAVLWALAIVSPLPEARYNEVLLVFIPFDLALLWMSARSRRLYTAVRMAVVLLAVALSLAHILFVQPLWIVAPFPVLALMPIYLLAGVGGAPSRNEPRVEPE
jgi:hypothetical protein